MNELQIFNNEKYGEVRTAIINNEPYFMLADVCRVLDIKDNTTARRRLSEKGVHSMRTLTNGGEQQATFINESNLYKLAFTSRKKEAEEFTEWVTSEVLPSIIKYGGYIAKPLNQLDILEKSIQIMKEQQRRLEEHDNRLAEIESNIEQIKELEQINASNWRLYFGSVTRKIAKYYPCLDMENPYQAIRHEFYERLENEAHCNLNIRLKNKKELIKLD